jgi:hypothetical protein
MPVLLPPCGDRLRQARLGDCPSQGRRRPPVPGDRPALGASPGTTWPARGDCQLNGSVSPPRRRRQGQETESADSPGGPLRAALLRASTPDISLSGLDHSQKTEAHERGYPQGAQPGHVLMATDMLRSMDQQTRIGNNTTLCLDVDSRQEADGLYGALSEGGSEGSPMADMPWGAYWGVILDRYGIRWMVNHTPAS